MKNIGKTSYLSIARYNYSFSCSSRKIAKLKTLCQLICLNKSTNFQWAKISFTLDGTLQHSVELELISLNDGYGLGSCSEECLESKNKDIRNYL